MGNGSFPNKRILETIHETPACVLPLIPICGITLAECAELARKLAERIAAELHVKRNRNKSRRLYKNGILLLTPKPFS